MKQTRPLSLRSVNSVPVLLSGQRRSVSFTVRVSSSALDIMPSKRQRVDHEAPDAGATAVMSRHPQSAVGGPIRSDAAEGLTATTSASTSKGTFRFWHEERRFKGSGERCIVQRALFEHGGVRIGGYPKAAPIPGPLGWQRPGDWDFLWAPARLALKAVPHLKPGQLVSACPGLMSITKKRRLPATLKLALGENLAWQVVPQSFSLPEELPRLAAHAAATAAVGDGTAPGADAAIAASTATGADGVADADGVEGSGARGHGTSAESGKENGKVPVGDAVAEVPLGTVEAMNAQPGDDQPQEQQQQRLRRCEELWILKTAQHLGKGLKLVPLAGAAAEASRPRRRPSQKPYVLAQQYVDRPLLVEGRKFGIRVWVAVTGFNPLRAYLHANGLVLFSTHGYDNNTWRTETGDVALGHITNYAQNMDGTVWNLKQLEEHLGREAYGKMWRKVQRNSALVIAATLRDIKLEHEALKVSSGTTFEVVGLDFLVDTDLHPWLLEVNGTPSLQVEHEDPRVEQLIHEQKYGMVQDLMSLLGLRERFKPRYTALRAAAKAKQHPIAAAAANGTASLTSAAAKGSLTSPTAALPRKLREQLQPTSDAAMMDRVVHELSYRAGFEPLMPLMPMAGEAGVSIPWDERDFQLRDAMATGVTPLVGEAATGLEGGSDEGGGVEGLGDEWAVVRRGTGGDKAQRKGGSRSREGGVHGEEGEEEDEEEDGDD